MARRRDQLAEEVVKAKTKLKADLNVAFPEILTINVFTKGILNLLSQYPSPKYMISGSSKEITSAMNNGD